MENDPLAALQPLHLPPDISWWPPAPGWWLLLLLLFLLLLALGRLWLPLYKRLGIPGIKGDLAMSYPAFSTVDSSMTRSPILAGTT